MHEAYFEKRNSKLSYYKNTDLWSVPHLHREVELIYVKRGNVHAYADKKSFDLKTGDVFIAFPNQIHYYENPVDGDYRIFIFSPDLIYGLTKVLIEQYPHHRTNLAGSMEYVINLLDHFDAYSGNYTETIQIGMINQIVGAFLDNFELRPRVKKENYTISEVFRFCEQNFREDITLDSIAKELHFSKYHLSHLLNEKLGISFNYYLKTLRVNAACDLLTQTNQKLSDISENVGFGSIRSFNRAFMEIMDTTPLRYRKSATPPEKISKIT